MDDCAIPLHGVHGCVIRYLVRTAAEDVETMKGGDPISISVLLGIARFVRPNLFCLLKTITERR